MKTYKLSELYEMSSGISSKKEQAGHGSPFASFSTVFNNTFLPDVLPDLMDTSEKEKETYSIKAGDIFLTRTSETLDELGMSSVAVKDYPNASYSGFLKRLRPTQKNITYAKFMAFYLRSYLFRKTMNNNATMTLRASLNEQIFSYLDIVLPEYNEQIKIGDLFHKISQKIEINNKINAALEAMAKTLYDYWFVQFDFPDKNGKPYKSSEGKMIFNEELKREIPVGWEVETLLSIANFQNGLACQKFRPIDDNFLNVIKIKDMKEGFSSKTEKVRVDVPDKIKVFNGDILFSWSASLEVIQWSGGKGALNQHIFKVTSDKYPKSYYYFELLNYLQHFKMMAELRKTTMGHITQEHLKQSRIVIPPKEIINQLDKLINPILDKINKGKIENQKLSELRDWLLPMLMNGQVRVGEK
ncbi:restriction endonuclease subunit S [Tenacibaculum finnmarkense]|uniref:restriction endonuclease subunit S n=1 Tax=Tenacibaculum finnmarkense TaxID=2781243 RepID=UPI0018E948B0|nr:restriction endonuclease subunit S [Tenacibaculum finnmarkense]